MNSFNCISFHYSSGIPYAKPPVGDLRLARPQRLDKPWDGVLQATKAAQPCLQPTLLGSYLLSEGQEDCLYLNVYVPYREDTVSS